jgi:hypothetical protein
VEVGVNDLRKKPGPKKLYTKRRHFMLTDEEVEALEAEAERQRLEYEDQTSVSEVIRQCIRAGLHLDD